MKQGLTKLQEEKLIILAKKYNLKLLTLFGSRAKGDHKKNSDYDLAFIPSNNFKITNEISLFDEIGDLFEEKPFDLINLENNHNVVLRQQIFQYGYILYENKKNLFEKEKEFAYFDYIDSITLLNPTKEKFLSNP